MLSEIKGIFKGKERKTLEGKIKQTEKKISDLLEERPHVLKDDGYPDVQAGVQTYRNAEAVVEQCNRELAEWSGRLGKLTGWARE